MPKFGFESVPASGDVAADLARIKHRVIQNKVTEKVNKEKPQPLDYMKEIGDESIRQQQAGMRAVAASQPGGDSTPRKSYFKKHEGINPSPEGRSKKPQVTNPGDVKQLRQDRFNQKYGL